MKIELSFYSVIILFFLTASILLVGCQKDNTDPAPDNSQNEACDNIECLNGGVCVDGTCDCPDGFSGVDCGLEDEPCGGVQCQNGGVCIDDECDCPDGFSGIDCSIQENPCSGLDCQNGGLCTNGECICTEGYVGVECEDQITPSIIRVIAIEVDNIPEDNIPEDPFGSTVDWDANNGPDIYVVLRHGFSDEGEIIGVSEVYANVDTSDDYVFTLDDPFIITDPQDMHTLQLMDLDESSEDDHMGGVVFTPYHSSNDFPAENTHGSYFKWYLEYEW